MQKNIASQPNKASASAGIKKKSCKGVLHGVSALVKAGHGEWVAVSGVTFRIKIDEHKKRWYCLESAPPGSPIDTYGKNSVKIHERYLFLEKPPSEKDIGLAGILLWDHLSHNGIKDALRTP